MNRYTEDERNADNDLLQVEEIISGVLQNSSDTPVEEERLRDSARKIGYLPFFQGRRLNDFFHTYTGKGQESNLNGDLIIRQDDLEIKISGYNNLPGGVGITAKLLWEALILELTEHGRKGNLIELPLKKYMEWRLLENVGEARKQVGRDLKALQRIELSLTDKVFGKRRAFPNICLEEAKLANGYINVRISPSFLELIRSYSFMYYPSEILAFSPLYNRHSPYLLRRLAVHQRMNNNKRSERTIAVKSLLESLPELPNYDDIREQGQITKKIIQPFERDMNAIKSIHWRYCGKNGVEIERPVTYRQFIEAMIHFSLTTTPD